MRTRERKFIFEMKTVATKLTIFLEQCFECGLFHQPSSLSPPPPSPRTQWDSDS